jgi:alkylation response protein AidB-like acyl-CoA dehydrogenase
MRFAFTAEQLELRDALRDLLEKECPPEVARLGHSAELWKRLAEMGVLGLRRDMDETDLVLLLEEAGRYLVPGPLMETAAVAVRALGDQWEEDSPVTAGFGNAPVAHADVAEVLLLEREGAMYAVSPGRATIEPEGSFSPARPTFRVRWEVSGARRLTADAALVFDHAALGASAELIGIASRLIEMAAGYAREREQFERPIGSFQAVKHLLADALIRLEFARPAVYRAAWSVARNIDERSRDVSMAKALASDAAALACRTALQVHGAIGYTEEHDLHLWLKHGWALAWAWGTADWHRERVAQAVIDRG